MKRPAILRVILFVLTLITTTLAAGPLYAVTIIGILLAHEMGHYLACRHHRVQATLPLFIPMISLFGTMGAVIKIQSPIPHRKALFDIGVAGPLAGLFFAFPAALVGIYLSEVKAIPTAEATLTLGEPLLFSWLVQAVWGSLPEGQDLFLHPVAFAAWAAFFVTAINLFPAGQLDGGHIVYALFGPKRARTVSWLVVLALVILGATQTAAWFVFAALILFLAMRHPPPTDDYTPLDSKRRRLGIITLVFLVLCFSPMPVQILDPTTSVIP